MSILDGLFALGAIISSSFLARGIIFSKPVYTVLSPMAFIIMIVVQMNGGGIFGAYLCLIWGSTLALSNVYWNTKIQEISSNIYIGRVTGLRGLISASIALLIIPFVTRMHEISFPSAIITVIFTVVILLLINIKESLFKKRI
ncbi:hypothetical protein [Xenorhabdus bovienii]|uniref:hypothetical protein n=1 Tax=Xenorhabdus bovienii TaxID=40576 RepID=UPI000571A476|nr:hypothetical protein [Xenorhabdus bovienii]